MSWSLQACVSQLSKAQSKLPRLCELRWLNLHILEAHQLLFKLVPNPYCIVSRNQVKMGKTHVKTAPDPISEEEFVLDDIPPDLMTVTITVLSQEKRGKDSDGAKLIVDLC
ncbi:hypothetical protein quinque_003957 [Culex quinquefasciatus]